MGFLLDDLFDVKDIDTDGKKFDNGAPLRTQQSSPSNTRAPEQISFFLVASVWPFARCIGCGMQDCPMAEVMLVRLQGPCVKDPHKGTLPSETQPGPPLGTPSRGPKQRAGTGSPLSRVGSDGSHVGSSWVVSHAARACRKCAGPKSFVHPASSYHVMRCGTPSLADRSDVRDLQPHSDAGYQYRDLPDEGAALPCPASRIGSLKGD